MNIHNVNASSNFTVRNFNNRQSRENLASLPERVISSAMQQSVTLNISDEARALAASVLTMHEPHGGIRQEQTELGLEEALGFNESQFLAEARRIAGENSLSTEDNALLAGMGSRLITGFTLGTSINMGVPNHAHTMANMANEYATIRQELEEQFSGEELERRLGLLSEAFNLSTQIHAYFAESQVRSDMSFEYFKMQAHNYTTENRHRMYNPRHLFNAGVFDKEETRNTANAIANAVRNSIIHFANLTRQFVLENGQVNTSQLGELSNFLNNSDSAEGGLSFGALNDVSRITSQRGEVGRSNTQFDELAHVISR